MVCISHNLYHTHFALRHPLIYIYSFLSISLFSLLPIFEYEIVDLDHFQNPFYAFCTTRLSRCSSHVLYIVVATQSMRYIIIYDKSAAVATRTPLVVLSSFGGSYATSDPYYCLSTARTIAATIRIIFP